MISKKFEKGHDDAVFTKKQRALLLTLFPAILSMKMIEFKIASENTHTPKDKDE